MRRRRRRRWTHLRRGHRQWRRPRHRTGRQRVDHRQRRERIAAACRGGRRPRRRGLRGRRARTDRGDQRQWCRAHPCRVRAGVRGR